MAPVWSSTVDEAVASIRRGQTVALGGFLSTRHPMALVRALLRRNVRDLVIIAPAGGIDADLMIASGAVRKIIFGACSLDLAGPAPAFRRAAESGTVATVDYGVASLYRAFEAGWRGLPAQPARYLLGSAMRPYHPARNHRDRADLVCLPALRPDVALIHADRATVDGDVRFLVPALDMALAWASERVIVSVERVVDRSSGAHWGSAGIARDHVHVLVEAPWGAHPCSCPPEYSADLAYIMDYRDRLASDEKPESAARHYFESPEQDYRKRIGVAAASELRKLATSGGQLGWNAPLMN